MTSPLAATGGACRRSSALRRALRLTRTAVATLAVAAPLGAVAVVASAPPAAAVTPGWQVDTSYSPVVGGLQKVSCSTASNCAAVGVAQSSTAGVAVVTSNAGSTWTEASLPAGTGPLYGVTCVTSTTTCFAVGSNLSGSTGTILTSGDSGATWTAQGTPANTGALYDVACPTTSMCFAVGSDPTDSEGVVVSTTNGSTWSEAAYPASGTLYGVACTATNNCVAVGTDTSFSFGFVQSYNGAAWTEQGAPGNSSAFLEVSCTASTTCYAAGAYTDPNTFVTTGIMAADIAGGGWSTQSIPGGSAYLSGVKCVASTTDCYAVGSTAFGGGAGFVIATTNGTTWTGQSSPGGVGALFSVTCTSTSTCEAVGSDSNGQLGIVIDTTTSGASWANQTLPSGTGSLNSTACPSATTCFAVGNATAGGVVENTTNSGGTWASQSLPSGSGNLLGVSCASTTACITVGTNTNGSSALSLGTSNGGTTWTTQVLPVGAAALTSVSCVTATTTCVAVGGNEAGTVGLVDDTTTAGATWAAQSLPAGVGVLFGVTCPSTTTCYAVGTDPNFSVGMLVATTNGGATWSTQSLPAGSGVLYGISCTSTTTCETVGTNPAGSTAVIFSTTNGGATWAAQTSQGQVAVLTSVDCPVAGTCFATGYDANANGMVLVTPNSGATWFPQTIPPATGPLGSVACPTSPSFTTCYASGLTTSGGGLILSDLLPVPTVTGISPASGPQSGSTYVTITGTGFSLTPGATSVAFGGVPSPTVSCFSNNDCVAVSPPAASAGSVDVTVTVMGQASAASASDLYDYLAPVPGPYSPVTPLRICDTRPGNQSSLSGDQAQCNGAGNVGRTLGGGGTLTINVAGHFGVPANASAVVLNVTVISRDPGYLTVFPAGQVPPTASNLNYTSNDVVPNLVEVGIGQNGQVSFYSYATVDVVVDLEGYVAPTSSLGTGGGLYNPLAAPARICDTRSGNPSSLSGTDAQCNGRTMAAGSTLTIQVTGAGNVPAVANVSAVVLNVTVVYPADYGYLTVWPQGVTRPTASNLNFTPSQIVPNRVIVPVSASGQVSIYSPVGTDVLVDVSGWYSTPADATGYQFSAEGAPVRICDTRSGNPSNLSGGYAQCNGHTLGTAGSRTVTAGGLASVPANAAAVVLNVTAVLPSNFTYVTVYPSGSPPTVSDLNPYPGEVEPNLVVATLSNTGTFNLYNAVGTNDIVVDVLGWYS